MGLSPKQGLDQEAGKGKRQREAPCPVLPWHRLFPAPPVATQPILLSSLISAHLLLTPLILPSPSLQGAPWGQTPRPHLLCAHITPRVPRSCHPGRVSLEKTHYHPATWTFLVIAVLMGLASSKVFWSGTMEFKPPSEFPGRNSKSSARPSWILPELLTTSYIEMSSFLP